MSDDCEWKEPAIPLFTVGVGEKGRGLFANTDIPCRTIIHVAPCVLCRSDEYDKHLRHTCLEHYLFKLKPGDKLLALGYGSLFNHDKSPNVDYRKDESRLLICFLAARQITKGDELCISYGSNLWFEDVDGRSDTTEEDLAEDFLNRVEL